MLRNEPKFYVVQFMETPFEGIDDYVCLPDTWLILRTARKETVFVTYPANEDPIVTRERVKRKERYNDKWRYYMASIKYESDTYSDAEQWIAARNDCGPLVINESKTTDTQKNKLKKKLQSFNENQSSKVINDSWKPLPRPTIKREAPSEPKELFVGKQLKLDEAAPSSSAFITDANIESKKEQSIKQNTQAQHTKQKKQALSLPVEDVNGLPKVMDKENHFQGSKKSDRNKSSSESHRSSKTTDSRCITKKSNTYYNQPKSQNSRMKISSTGQNSTNPTYNKYIQNEHQLKVNQSKRALVNVSYLNEMRNVRQIEEKSLTSYHGVNSVSNAVTNHEVHMSTDNAPMEPTSNFFCNNITSGRDRPATSLNSTLPSQKSEHPEVLLKPTMLKSFENLYTQMGSTLQCTDRMYKTLKSSFVDIAKIYKRVKDSVEEFNKSVSNAFPANDLTPEFPQFL